MTSADTFKLAADLEPFLKLSRGQSMLLARGLLDNKRKRGDVSTDQSPNDGPLKGQGAGSHNPLLFLCRVPTHTQNPAALRSIAKQTQKNSAARVATRGEIGGYQPPNARKGSRCVYVARMSEVTS